MNRSRTRVRFGVRASDNAQPPFAPLPLHSSLLHPQCPPPSGNVLLFDTRVLQSRQPQHRHRPMGFTPPHPPKVMAAGVQWEGHPGEGVSNFEASFLVPCGKDSRPLATSLPPEIPTRRERHVCVFSCH